MSFSRGVVVAYNGADAGLGNRLRVTLGGARFARWRGSSFAYVWPSTPAFEPRLTELFEWKGGVRISRPISRASAKLTGYVGADLRETGQRRVVQIRTGAELILPDGAGSWTDDLRALAPVAQVAEAVRQLHGSVFGDEPYVGVQVRAHQVSHRETKDTSPVSWFTDRMQQIVDERPDTRFYISCDVPETKRQLLELFPTATAHVVDAAYNSTAAVRAAIVDLYLLASSSYMLGPHFSSFVEMAQHLAALTVPTDKPSERRAEPREWWKRPAVVDPLRPAVRLPEVSSC